MVSNILEDKNIIAFRLGTINTELNKLHLFSSNVSDTSQAQGRHSRRIHFKNKCAHK